MCASLSDGDICRIAQVLPANLEHVATTVLGLTLEQYEVAFFTPTTLTVAVKRCLQLGATRKLITSVSDIIQILDKAMKDNLLSPCYRQQLTTIEEDRTLEESIIQLAPVLVQHMDKYSMEKFFSKYFSITFAEFSNVMPERLSHNAVAINILKLWRGLHHGRNSMECLMEKLGAHDVLDVDCLAVPSRQVADSSSSYAQYLANYYSENFCTLNPVPWLSTVEPSVLDEVFVTLYVTNSELTESKTISMNELFVQESKKSGTYCKRILLHGEAGSGKTTLTSKIALDWANMCDKIKSLQQFEAVFVIRANLIVEGESVYRYLRRECLPRDVKFDDLENSLSTANVLLMIDGYDEKRCNKDFIVDLLTRKLLTNCTILLTSRFGATSKIRKHFDLNVSLKGFSENDIKTFIGSYADEKTKTNFLEMYAMNHPFIQILRNPLYLWFFVLLGEEYFQDIQKFTRTDFFIKAISGITDKAVYKLSIEESCVEDAMEKLCQLAYQCMVEDTLQIHDASHVDSVMSQLGFLNVVVSRTGLKERRSCMFPHRSILEFLAASYISQSNPDEVVPLMEALPELQDTNRRQSSMLLLFMFGLMKNHSNVICEIISIFVPILPVLPVMEADENEYDPYVSCQHNRHLGLACLCELDDVSMLSYQTLEGRIDTTVMLNNTCTPYCLRGLEHFSSLKKLESLTIGEFPSYPSNTIHTKSCKVYECDGLVLAKLISSLSESLESLRLLIMVLSIDDYYALITSLITCKSLVKLQIDKMELGQDVEQYYFSLRDSLPRLKTLWIHMCPGNVASFFICLWWHLVDSLELLWLRFSEADVDRICNNILTTTAPTTLKLIWLHDDSSSLLAKGLCDTNILNTLLQLEVRCRTDMDCRDVTDFIVGCKCLSVLKWRTRRVIRSESFSSWSSVSEGVLSDMWFQIATKATKLHTVVIQEYTDKFYKQGQREDDVFLSMIINRLSQKQREAIKWQELHLIDKHFKVKVSDSTCQDIYKCLPNIGKLLKGCEGDQWTGGMAMIPFEPHVINIDNIV